MTLSAQFSSKSSIPSIESAFTARYVNLSAAGAYTDSAQTGTRNGSDSNGTSIAEPQLREAVCLPRAAAEALCEQRNQTSYFCPRKQGTIVVIVEEQIVVINNITKVVTTDGDKTTDFILQKEIDAFLKSFASPKKFFYGSNLGIGNFANLVLWVAFLFFCVVAIILQWMSARRPKHKIALLMLTLDNVIAMLGYLTMAFGHGRMYDDTAIFRAQKNETSGATFFTGSLVQVPTVPPFFYALYISWLLSTPPVLFVLCDLAGARSFLLSCLVLDVCMLLAGLGCAYMGKYEVARAVPARVAELRQASKWILFVVACACFAGLARQLAGPVKRKALKTGTLQVYSPLVWFTLAVWVCYPVVFLLTEAGLGLVGTDEEVVLFTLLDMVPFPPIHLCFFPLRVPLPYQTPPSARSPRLASPPSTCTSAARPPRRTPRRGRCRRCPSRAPRSPRARRRPWSGGSAAGPSAAAPRSSHRARRRRVRRAGASGFPARNRRRASRAGARAETSRQTVRRRALPRCARRRGGAGAFRCDCSRSRCRGGAHGWLCGTCTARRGVTSGWATRCE